MNIQPNNEKVSHPTAKQAQYEPRTQVEILRNLLKDLELRIARLHESSPNTALEIPNLLDLAMEKIDHLRQAGGITGSEDSYFETITSQFYSKRRQFLTRIGGASVLVKARQENSPSEDRWWWFVDQAVVQERWAFARRMLMIGGIIVLFLIGLFGAYQLFWKPDPAVQASIGYQTKAENLLIEERYEQALVEVNHALVLTPDNPDLLVMRGVLYEILEQPELAEEDFKTAKNTYPNEDSFFTIRSGYYVMTNQPELALADAETSTEINPDSAMGFVRKAQAYESLGDVEKAIENYQLGSDAAERTGDPQLQVIARMSMAQLMQSAPLITPRATDELEIP